MQIKLDGWLYAKPNEYDSAHPQIKFWEGKDTAFWIGQGYVPICEHTIEADAPEINIVDGQVKCLLARKSQLTKDFETAIGKVDDALKQLQCLTFDATSGAVS